MKNFTANSTGQAGNVMMELAVVIPFVLGLVFFGIESARMMQISELTVGLSRELAVQATRGCYAKLPEDLAEPAVGTINYCLKKVLDRFEQQSQNVYPNLDFVVTLYRSNLGVGPIDGPYRIGNTMKSRFDVAVLQTTDNIVAEALYQNRKIIIAEIFAPYSTILPQIPGFNTGYQNGEMYAYTIL